MVSARWPTAAGVQHRARRSPALAVAADMTLGAPLGERQLRTAIRAGAEKLLLPAPIAEQLAGTDGLPDRHGARGSTGGGAQQILLDALLVLHPLLERDPDRVGHRQHLVGPEADGAVGRDAAQLPVDLLERNAGAQGERDESPDRFDVGHEGAARLAERDEHLERLA